MNRLSKAWWELVEMFPYLAGMKVQFELIPGIKRKSIREIQAIILETINR